MRGCIRAWWSRVVVVSLAAVVTQGVAIPGATMLRYTIPRVHKSHFGVYVCRAFNDVGFADSRDLVLHHAMDGPMIVRASDDALVHVGDDVTLEVVAKGDPMPSYQWYIDGSPLDDADGPTLVIHNFGEDLQGTYTCDVYNDAGRVSSRRMVVSVAASPPTVALSCPEVVHSRFGASATVSVSAAGVPFPTLQWYRDGVPIPAATSARFVIKCVDFESMGEYVCRATNDAGAVDSPPCSVSLAHEAPVIEWQPSRQSVWDGAEVSLKLVARGIPPPR